MLRNSVAAALAAPWRVGLLALAIAVVWCAHHDRWTLESWSVPTVYEGDALEIFARIEAAAEGDGTPLRPQIIRRLGAPHGANWNAYPSSDAVLLWGIGQLARLIGVFAAANVALLLANVTAGLAFYGCARWLRTRWEWAFTGALLFAFTLQTFQRGISHLFLIFSWTVPLALLTCAWVAQSRHLELRSKAGALCLATAVVIGIGNPYVLFLFLQLLGWALIVQFTGGRRRANLLTGGLMLAASLVAFAVVESHLWVFTDDTAARSPLVRSYAGTELYAMKLVELFLPPPGHRWDALAELGFRYLDWSDFRSGESSMSYLGIVGIAGLVWLAAASIRRMLARQRPPTSALPATWIIAFSSLGGVTNLFALLTGLVVFRATTRFSIFISAIALLFIVSRLTRWSSFHPRWLSYTAAILLTALGLIDQLPRAAGREAQVEIARRIAADRELGRAVEKAVPRQAMVFQLPVLEFPEATPAYQLDDYAYFRPYLATQTLRFSYGALKRRSRSHWQTELASLPTRELVRRLEHFGFAGVYFHRDAFPDRGEHLLRELSALGRTEKLEDPLGEQVFVTLRPTPRPIKPMAQRLTFGRGWHGPRTGEPRWAYGPAALSYYNPLPNPVRTRARFVLTGVGQRNVQIRLNHEEATRACIGSGQHPIELDLTLQAGVNRIDIESQEPPVRLDHGQDQLRAFGLYEAALSIEPVLSSPAASESG